MKGDEFKMKRKRVIFLSTMVCLLLLSIGIAMAASTKAEDKQMEIGDMTIPGFMSVGYKSGVLYDEVSATFYFKDNDTPEQDAALLGSKVVIEVRKYRNDALLETRVYNNNDPKPCRSMGTKYSYSDNWVYRANGTKLVVKTQKSSTSTALVPYDLDTK